jgi:hypothetical protein
VISFLAASDADRTTILAAREVYRSRFGAKQDGEAAAGYVLQGFHWKGSTTSWSYNPAGKPVSTSGEQEVIAAAATTWNNAGSSFSYTSSGLSTAGTGGCHGTADGKNTVGWARQPAGVLATTCAWYNAGVASEFDLEMDPSWPWTTSTTNPDVDLQSVVTHELGHALGLAHSLDPAAVMFASYPHAAIRRDLTDDDRSAISAVYGATPSRPAPSTKAFLALSTGANLVTWAGGDAQPAHAFASVIASVREVYALDPATGGWRRYIPDAPAYVSDLEMLHSGTPYWVITSAAATLTIEP